MGRSHSHLKSVDGSDESVPKPKRRTTRTSFVITEYWKEKCEEEADRQGCSLSEVYMRAISEYFESRSTVGSWDTAEEADSYDPKKFYTASQDKKGHSFHARVNLPKPVVGQISGLIQSGRIPQLRSIEDLIRDGTYHRVKQIARMIDDGELEDTIDLAMLTADEMLMMQQEEAAQEYVAAVRDNVQRLESRGAVNELGRYLAERAELAEALPMYWRRELLALIGDYKRSLERKKRRRRGRGGDED